MHSEWQGDAVNLKWSLILNDAVDQKTLHFHDPVLESQFYWFPMLRNGRADVQLILIWLAYSASQLIVDAGSSGLYLHRKYLALLVMLGASYLLCTRSVKSARQDAVLRGVFLVMMYAIQALHDRGTSRCLGGALGHALATVQFITAYAVIRYNTALWSCAAVCAVFALGVYTQSFPGTDHTHRLNAIALLFIGTYLATQSKARAERSSRYLYYLLTDPLLPLSGRTSLADTLRSYVVDNISRTLPILRPFEYFPEMRMASNALESSIRALQEGTVEKQTMDATERAMVDLYSGRATVQAHIRRNVNVRSEEADLFMLAEGSESSQVSTSRFIYNLRAPPRRLRREHTIGNSAIPMSPRLLMPPTATPEAAVGESHSAPMITTRTITSSRTDEDPSSQADESGRGTPMWDDDDRDANFEEAKKAVSVSCDLFRGHFALLDLWLQTTLKIPAPPVDAEDQRIVGEWDVPQLTEPGHRRDHYQPLFTVGYQYLSAFENRDPLMSDSLTLRRFLYAAQHMYLNHPYHNAYHAAQVMHSAVWLATVILGASATNSEMISFALAAIGHDLGHPGRTNGYLIARQNTLALVYNDAAVLENYHAALLFALLAHPNFNVTRDASREAFFKFRKSVTEVILATDMASHFEITNRWKRRRVAEDFDLDGRDRSSLFCMMMKAGDLSHGALNFKSHRLWSERVRDEFFLQGDEEATLALPISPLCDRAAFNSKAFAAGQSGFLRVLVLPLYSDLATVCPGTDIGDECCGLLSGNIEAWDEIARATG